MNNNVMTELVFIIDTSGSMYSNKMAAVNAALVECIDVICNNISQYGVGINVSYMTFDSSASSIQYISDIRNKGFPKFEVKSENGFYKITRFDALYDGIICFTQNRKPANAGIILVTDGKVIDTSKYAEKLEIVKNNDYFRKANRLVACVEKDDYVSDSDLLEFVGFKADKIIDLNRLANQVDVLCRQLLGNIINTDTRNDVYDSIFGKN